MKVKAIFFKTHFFGLTFKVLKIDKAMLKYHIKQLDIHANFVRDGNSFADRVVLGCLRLYVQYTNLSKIVR